MSRIPSSLPYSPFWLSRNSRENRISFEGQPNISNGLEWRESEFCAVTTGIPGEPPFFHLTGRKFDVPVYTTRDIYIKALRLLNMSGYKKRVRNVAVSVYDLIPSTDEQLELFSSPAHAVSETMDEVNNKWGEFVITPALMMDMDDIILDRIAFGGVKELEDMYAD
jgi:hypothetical protein